MKLLLDTHAWLWWHMEPERLTAKGRKAIQASAASGDLLLSAFSVWEVAKLVEKGRLRLSCETETWVRQALEATALTLVPLTPQIACKACALPPPFHGDPADQIIAATARVEGATLLTSDDRLRDYPHCRTLW